MFGVDRKLIFSLTVALVTVFSVTLIPTDTFAQALRVLTGPQGGTGIGTATGGDIGTCLKVLSVSPLTYELGACGTGGGSGGTDTLFNWNTGTNIISTDGSSTTATTSLSTNGFTANNATITNATSTTGWFSSIVRALNSVFTNATTTNLRTTQLGVGSDYITDLTGTGLSIVGNALTATNDHVAVTVSGARDYITLSGQDIVRGVVDVSDDTNLSGDTEVVLTGDALSLGESLTFTSATATNLASTLSTTSVFYGAGLTDCDTGASSKLLWDVTTGKFSCGTDQNSGGSGASDWNQSLGTYLTPSTTVGIRVAASSTIGDGTSTGGLTISGRATTTGELLIANTGSNGALPPITALQVGPNTNLNAFSMSRINTTANAGPANIGYRGGGTNASPSANLDGYELLELTGRGYDGTAWSTASDGAVRINAVGTWSPTQHGTNITFGTTASGTISEAVRMIIDHSGYVGIGTTSPSRLVTIAGGDIWLGGNLYATGTASSTYASTSALTVHNTIGLFGNTPASTANALCIQLTGSANLCDGSDDGGGGGEASDWQLGGSGYIVPSTTVGIVVSASSTIGNGTATGGLTVSGNSTTTGQALFTTGALSNSYFTVASQGTSLGDNGTARLIRATDDARLDLFGGTNIAALLRTSSNATEFLGQDGADYVSFLADTGASGIEMSDSGSLISLQAFGDTKFMTGYNFGIGSSTPSRKLTVAGDAIFVNTWATGTASSTYASTTGLTAQNGNVVNATGTTMRGFGLSDCDADNQTVAWDVTTGTFGCGDDDTGAGSSATGTTLVCASGCPYSDIQTALDAGVRNIQLKEETYAGPVRIKFSDTKITGAGATSTIITCDAAVNSPCVAMATTTRLTRMILRDFTIDNTNVTFLGTGLDTSDTSKVYASNIRSQEFNIAHLHQDTTNSSFYSRFENMDYYASSSCFKTAGTKSNMNTIDTARCIVTASAGIGYGFYDAEGWLLNSIDSEPGALIGTGVYIDATSIAITMVNPWMEGNATGTEIRAGALNTSIKGGRITAGTVGVYDGGTNTFLDSTLVSANTTNHTCPSTCLGSYINTSSTFGSPHILVGTTTQNTSFTRLGLNISTSEATANMLTLNNAGAFATAPAGLQFTHSSGAFPSGTARIYANPGSGYTNANLNFAVADSSQVLRDRLTINVSGFAGLGSTSPGHLLTVQGGNAYFGGNITATGTASTSALVVDNSINIFGGGAKTTANALCIQLTGSANLCDGSDDGAGGGGEASDWDQSLGTYLSPTTSLGIRVVASSTIGGGTNTSGLSIFGGATTTGDSFFGGTLTIAPSRTITAPLSNTTLHVVGTDSNPLRISLDSYQSGSTFGSQIQGRRARGTSASPSQVVTDDTLLSLGADGYGTTGYHAASTGNIAIRAEATTTDSSAPTYIGFFTTATGTVTATERMRITAGGFVGIGSSTPNSVLSVASSTYNYLSPLFSVATSSDVSAGILTVFSTSTLATNATSSTAIVNGSRVQIGPLPGFLSDSGATSQFFNSGRIESQFEYFYCRSDMVSVAATADTNGNCGDASYQEDQTGGTSALVSLNMTPSWSVPGITLADGTTQSGSGMFFAQGNVGISLGSSTPVFETGVRVTAGASSTIYSGFFNTNPPGTTFELHPTTGAFFRAASTTNNWLFVIVNAANSSTTYDTGIASTSLLMGKIAADQQNIYAWAGSTSTKMKLLTVQPNNLNAASLYPGSYFGRSLAGRTTAEFTLVYMELYRKKLYGWFNY